MKAKIDAELCIGCGLCVELCPGVFEMKEDKAIVKVAKVASGEEDCAKKSVDDCPVTAIIVE